MGGVCTGGDKSEKLGVQPPQMKSTDEPKSEVPRSNSMNIQFRAGRRGDSMGWNDLGQELQYFCKELVE